jgi:hypothetical protein
MTPDTRAALRRLVETWQRKADHRCTAERGHDLDDCAHDVLALLDTAPEPEPRPERASEHLGAAFLEAWDKARAEPETPPTCATCRHLKRRRLPNDEWEAWCPKLIGLELDDTPDGFHCSLHQPREDAR